MPILGGKSLLLQLLRCTSILPGLVVDSRLVIFGVWEVAIKDGCMGGLRLALGAARYGLDFVKEGGNLIDWIVRRPAGVLQVAIDLDGVSLPTTSTKTRGWARGWRRRRRG